MYVYECVCKFVLQQTCWGQKYTPRGFYFALLLCGFWGLSSGHQAVANSLCILLSNYYVESVDLKLTDIHVDLPPKFRSWRHEHHIHHIFPLFYHGAWIYLYFTEYFTNWNEMSYPLINAISIKQKKISIIIVTATEKNMVFCRIIEYLVLFSVNFCMCFLTLPSPYKNHIRWRIRMEYHDSS